VVCKDAKHYFTSPAGSIPRSADKTLLLAPLPLHVAATAIAATAATAAATATTAAIAATAACYLHNPMLLYFCYHHWLWHYSSKCYICYCCIVVLSSLDTGKAAKTATSSNHYLYTRRL
jgi:hypothetical protein